MSRMLVVSNVVLALVVCLLVWRQQDDQAFFAGDASSATPPHAVSHGQASQDADALQRLSARLDRIDGRLDALARTHPSEAVSDTAPSPTDTLPMSAAEADRRLAGMLPGPVVDHEAMARYRAQLAMLPGSHQAAIEAALSRAINQDRLRLRL